MKKLQTLPSTTFQQKFRPKTEDLFGMMIEANGQHIMLRFQTFSQTLDDLAENQRTVDLLSRSAVICKHICSPTAKTFYNMRGFSWQKSGSSIDTPQRTN
ncbi:unnamed protein product [Brassica oleracea]